MTTMGTMPSQPGASNPGPAPAPAGRPTLFDISSVDFSDRTRGKEEIHRWIPHRDRMSLLDYIVWMADDMRSGVGLWHVRPDEFWVSGHFPGRPLLPGVLQIEAGAQLCTYLFNKRTGVLNTAAFTRINETSFRSSAQPGDDLILLAKELKFYPRRFVSRIQGLVQSRIVFEAEIEGMILRV